MPYVSLALKAQHNGLSVNKKNQLIRRFTEVLKDTLGKNPATTLVVIHENNEESANRGNTALLYQVTREKGRPTEDEKDTLRKEGIRILKEVLGHGDEPVDIQINEISTDNWGLGGESITEKRKKE
ncbi:tautomerase family protein [Thalassorhabdus alkalitolerans]|uniref:Tautomerase family protein n=1 Tax=Thalassorhabdus alkalitolerans TaxID=2282697 RepID=A0ABW0YLE3_9BACI|nr:tautomerase family protein [Thalassobacillus sp. C254]